MSDPYGVLGVKPTASDDEVRTAYRRLVQLHHPDHNGGSAESARRFEEVQDAYAQVTRLRREAPGPQRPVGGTAGGGGGGASARARPAPDPDLEARMADIERQVREAHEAREKARRAAAEAAARTEKRPTDEELGYIKTDDTFTKVLADARSELAAKLSDGEGTSGARKRVADLLDDVAAMLRRER
jgi:DnaJ-class molecular chaperone